MKTTHAPANPVTLYRREKARSQRRNGKAYQRLMSLAASEFRRQIAIKKGGRPRKAPADKPCTRCLGPVERLRSRRLTVCDRCASPRELYERSLIRGRAA